MAFRRRGQRSRVMRDYGGPPKASPVRTRRSKGKQKQRQAEAKVQDWQEDGSAETRAAQEDQAEERLGPRQRQTVRSQLCQKLLPLEENTDDPDYEQSGGETDENPYAHVPPPVRTTTPPRYHFSTPHSAAPSSLPSASKIKINGIRQLVVASGPLPAATDSKKKRKASSQAAPVPQLKTLKRSFLVDLNSVSDDDSRRARKVCLVRAFDDIAFHQWAAMSAWGPLRCYHADLQPLHLTDNVAKLHIWATNELSDDGGLIGSCVPRLPKSRDGRDRSKIVFRAPTATARDGT
ncbi:hypothetical protein K458DRAFT_406902 [Lentithecium fluviatile CBS 122367]|uniref:Uncharacterized protein n=1 Tax=Lentithecium fluviatile CBS 122367 TaxID=1168545 RepID=A0A6G1IS06_9PLEO|nr:hypothetical protein K458DRAFT_406902 [Lentithecium fluviatile CBS 122367]